VLWRWGEVRITSGYMGVHEDANTKSSTALLNASLPLKKNLGYFVSAVDLRGVFDLKY
jgi:hypothetical protein